MVRPFPLALLVLFPLCACLPGARTVNAYGGIRQLEAGAFDDVDRPVTWGVDATASTDDSGLTALAVEAGYAHSDDDDERASLLQKVELDLDEYYAGLRLFFPLVPIVKPYVSAGISYVDAEFQDGSGSSFDDDGIAPYVRGGAAVQLGLVRVGADLRYLFASDLDLGPAGDVDGLVPTLFLGIAF